MVTVVAMLDDKWEKCRNRPEFNCNFPLIYCKMYKIIIAGENHVFIKQNTCFQVHRAVFTLEQICNSDFLFLNKTSFHFCEFIFTTMITDNSYKFSHCFVKFWARLLGSQKSHRVSSGSLICLNSLLLCDWNT